MLRPSDPAWHARIGDLARIIGSNEFHVGIARLLGDMIWHDYIVIVRYPLGGLPDILFTENFGRHLIHYYMMHAYEFRDPFYGYWRATARPCVLPLLEALGYARDRDFYSSVYQPKLGIADEVAVLLRGVGGACLGIFLGRRKSRFDDDEFDLLRLVFPAIAGFHKAHLARVLTRLVETARPGAADSFVQPMQITTRTGEHIFSNQAWREALRSDPQIGLAANEPPVTQGGRLRLPSGAVLYVERLDGEFALAPGGRMYTLELSRAEESDAKAAQRATADFQKLTPREREIVLCIIDGAGAADIARKLKLSKGTVKNHRLRMYRKFGLASERELFIHFLPLAENIAAGSMDRPRAN